MQVEICANSFESALAAQQGGADRIELCTELSVGGLTPSHGLIEKVTSELQIPVHVLIRPRSGNFTYSPAELDVMHRDIEFCKMIGCAGVVSGALNSDNTIAKEKLELLLTAAEGLCFTFHRAFDWCPDAIVALDALLQFPIKRLLTSGKEQTAAEGLSLLNQLLEKSNDQIEIMPGSGINIGNISAFKANNFKSVHLSAGKKIQVLQRKPDVGMHSLRLFEEGIVSTSQKDVISEIVSVCKR
ncbi:copper homeostasis protein CutC [Flavimarina sp. Hel_I_48]|uniref:copper homeostasis protein CutC n=1 Tax=Flavimarina sp. Hel_I_48 TaxID=1392488 RepID=UPI0004DF455A|nr:copper homeostasis protein CutC [Flavimarina sp. Hel_I_48]